MTSLLSARLPDESLYALVTRISWLNGLCHDREACTFLFGDRNEQRVGDAHVNIEHFCAVTRNVYGQPEALVGSTTVLPFFRHLGAYPKVASAYEQDAQDNVVDAVERGLGLAALSNGHAHLWRWCPVCAKEDMHEHGLAYWHRSHQLPGVIVCTQHCSSLLEVNLPYQARQQRFILPGSLPESVEKRISFPIDADLGLALKLAMLAETVLRDASQDASAAGIQGVIFDGLAERGLVSKGGRIRKREFAEGFIKCFSPISGNELISSLINERNLMRLASALTTSTQAQPALLNLMLIHWLFGSWKLFLEYYVWRETLSPADSQGKSPSDMRPINSQESLLRLHRKICISYLQHHIEATRSAFWRAHPRPCRWLTLHDRGWLDQHLPTTGPQRGIQLPLF